MRGITHTEHFPNLQIIKASQGHARVKLWSIIQSVRFPCLYTTGKSPVGHRHRDTITWNDPQIAGAGNGLAAVEEEGLVMRQGL